MTNGNFGQINTLQALRAYAALSVMLGHALLEVYSNIGVDPTFNVFPLIAGVDIFFVISGFVMSVTSYELFGVAGAFRLFIWKRFVRVVPLYWFFTTLMVLVLISTEGVVRSTQLDWGNVISSYLFFPSERPGGRVAPVLSLGWTLNYEVFFYFLYSLSLFFSRKIGFFVVQALLLLFVIFGWIAEVDSVALRFWTNSIILEFGAGVVLGAMYGRIEQSRNGFLAIFLIILGGVALLVLADHDIPRFVKGGLGAVLITLGCLTVPKTYDARMPSVVLLLGSASYALYLSHRFVLRTLSILFKKLSVVASLEVVLYPIIAVLISVLASLVVYRYLEVPFLRAVRRGRRSAVHPSST